MAIVIIIQEQEITHKIPVTKKPFVLGRSSKCNLKLHDPMVSGKHCAFQLSDDGKATVKDLDSSNGTYVNGFKIAEIHLMMDDEVKIGGIKCWLDASQMNPQEKKLHVRETAKTKMKYIDLGDEGEKKPRKAQTDKSKNKDPKEDDFDPKTSIIKVDLNEVAAADEGSGEDFTRTQISKSANKQGQENLTQEKKSEPEETEEGNDRLAKRVRKMEEKSKKQASAPGQAVAGENQFESEETGQTKFLKVDQGKNKKAKSIVKKKARAKKEEADEGNLLGKIKSIFKK
jgi:hypothetical protein